jgi:hypothetical protein
MNTLLPGFTAWLWARMLGVTEDIAARADPTNMPAGAW